MCRNIKTLYNFDPPATSDELHAAALQFVRKLTGFHTPSKANTVAFNQAIEDVTLVAVKLFDSLQTNASPHDREVEAQRARERSKQRFIIEKHE